MKKGIRMAAMLLVAGILATFSGCQSSPKTPPEGYKTITIDIIVQSEKEEFSQKDPVPVEITVPEDWEFSSTKREFSVGEKRVSGYYVGTIYKEPREPKDIMFIPGIEVERRMVTLLGQEALLIIEEAVSMTKVEEGPINPDGNCWYIYDIPVKFTEQYGDETVWMGIDFFVPGEEDQEKAMALHREIIDSISW